MFLQLINETKIVIVPSINPDGREQAAERQCNSTQGLGNANGKDLDREFFGSLRLRKPMELIFAASPYSLRFLLSFFLHAGNASEHVLKAQPETKAMMELILEKGYTLSVALDGGALVATYPYDRPVQPGNVSLLHLGHTCSSQSSVL